MPTADELYFNIRLEGETKFFSQETSNATGEGEIRIPTVVLIEAGLSGWKDQPYRAQVITEYRQGDADDKNEERKFETDEELCSYLESHIADLTAKGFETVRYKVNGMPIDWLNRINLPPDE